MQAAKITRASNGDVLVTMGALTVLACCNAHAMECALELLATKGAGDRAWLN